MHKIALVVGASGIVGNNLSKELLFNGWTTFGLARKPKDDIPGLQPVAADLLNLTSLSNAHACISPTHVFITSWMRNATEAENIRVNGAMVRNLLAVLSPKHSVQHVALVTGLKHYLGPFDAYAKEGFLPVTPWSERSSPALTLKTFTMPRKMKCTPPQHALALAGVSTDLTR